MNWIVFAIVAYVFTVLQHGLVDLLAVNISALGATSIVPGFLLILLVFLSISAPTFPVIWAALILGVLVDLSMPLAIHETYDVALIGPGALGFLFGGYMAVQLRGFVFRDSVITHALIVFIVGIFVHLVIVALITIRGLSFLPADPVVAWSAADELQKRFFSLIYTAIVAIPVSYILLKTTPLWNFQSDKGPKAARFRRS